MADKIIQLRRLGITITAGTPQKTIDKYLKDYPQLKNIKDAGSKAKASKKEST